MRPQETKVLSNMKIVSLNGNSHPVNDIILIKKGGSVVKGIKLAVDAIIF
ncbi:MAG: hypothetical protein ACI8P3_002785 [Saprospiraceae bacterium]|jgi:hypothetical protein